jgi:hypothetical protein
MYEALLDSPADAHGVQYLKSLSGETPHKYAEHSESPLSHLVKSGRRKPTEAANKQDRKFIGG